MSYTVHVERTVGAAPGEVWAALTEPSRVGQWFGDIDRLAHGQPFRCEFGDGDFFTGRATTWVEQRELGLAWRFMDIGPRFDITYGLHPVSDKTTLISVVDRGALTGAEADSLREGWTDFLGRLDGFLMTGARTRFAWSPAIGAGALVRGRVDDPLARFNASWLRQHFPGTGAGARARADGGLTIEFRDPNWSGRSSSASIDLHAVDEGTYIAVTHGGWQQLPPDLQLPERRRYAGAWQAALASLEAAPVLT